MTIKKMLRIEEKLLEKYRRLLTTEPKDESECMGEDEMDVFTAYFGDGIEMDLNICGVHYRLEEPSNLPWTEAVLFKDGCEVCHSDPGDKLEDEWSLEYDGDTYTAVVAPDVAFAVDEDIDRWCDGFGKPLYNGTHCSEDELPLTLQCALHDVWEENPEGCHCCIATHGEKPYIALTLPYGKDEVEKLGLRQDDTEDMWQDVVLEAYKELCTAVSDKHKEAHLIRKVFANKAGSGTELFEEHEIVVLLPLDISKEELHAAARYCYRVLYKKNSPSPAGIKRNVALITLLTGDDFMVFVHPQSGKYYASCKEGIFEVEKTCDEPADSCSERAFEALSADYCGRSDDMKRFVAFEKMDKVSCAGDPADYDE